MEGFPGHRFRRNHLRSQRSPQSHHSHPCSRGKPENKKIQKIQKKQPNKSSPQSKIILLTHSQLSEQQVEGRPDIVIDLTKPGALESLKDKPYTIKEGSQFRMKATFKVQHQILSGLKYVQVVKRMGVSNKLQEMIVRLFFSFLLSLSLSLSLSFSSDAFFENGES